MDTTRGLGDDSIRLSIRLVEAEALGRRTLHIEPTFVLGMMVCAAERYGPLRIMATAFRAPVRMMHIEKRAVPVARHSAPISLPPQDEAPSGRWNGLDRTARPWEVPHMGGHRYVANRNRDDLCIVARRLQRLGRKRKRISPRILLAVTAAPQTVTAT